MSPKVIIIRRRIISRESHTEPPCLGDHFLPNYVTKLLFLHSLELFFFRIYISYQTPQADCSTGIFSGTNSNQTIFINEMNPCWFVAFMR